MLRLTSLAVVIVHIMKRHIQRFEDRVNRFIHLLGHPVYFGRHFSRIPDGAIVFFPLRQTRLHCGLAGIVAYKKKSSGAIPDHMDEIDALVNHIESSGSWNLKEVKGAPSDTDPAGKAQTADLLSKVRLLKRADCFCDIFTKPVLQKRLGDWSHRLTRVIDAEAQRLFEHMGYLSELETDILSRRIETLKDVRWCLDVEILKNIEKIYLLLNSPEKPPAPKVIKVFKEINTVLNSIDRLEVRGRDSAGISLMFHLTSEVFEQFTRTLKERQLSDSFDHRLALQPLLNSSISVHEAADQNHQLRIALTVTYKIAAEIGKLGDNIRFLRSQIRDDHILHELAAVPHGNLTILSHTRWASVGAITEANCHPVDNDATGYLKNGRGIIHICLNGDIDNYQKLKAEYEFRGGSIPADITTDTKIIPLQIEKYVRQGLDLPEAFRLAVNDFEGSHAISMHSDLAPGKIFLAQKGSGQAIFIGLAEDHYVSTSEVYGLVEETSLFIKLDGEKIIDGTHGPTQGQIFILNQDAPEAGVKGIQAFYYDGTPIKLDNGDIRHTEITSRDIDRQNYAHYFLKEISESPVSVEKTIQNRWKVIEGVQKTYAITLDESVFPRAIEDAWVNNRIRRIFFVGQGTAGVAALACANILSHYLDDPSLYITALKASELSGFNLGDAKKKDTMADSLVIAISQSGTTTDTNRTVDMVKRQGARTLAIVNRRDSDITFKVDGVMYTSSGRDIEMSVASTKAFYAQIVAGAILSLHMAALKKHRTAEFISSEIQQLLYLPNAMRSILAMKEKIEDSATRHAPQKTYWAVVGSGPNKASADEIRIKLSELCYKTISSDFIEDKKHIDLSSEPLIVVCAAGTRETVIGDIIKDTAIFRAHKATPIIIANDGEHRFDSYAADVFHVPVVSEHVAPIVNTLVGHIWGYYAALAINEGSKFLYAFREDLQKTISDSAANDVSVFELILDKFFREKIVRFYENFRKKKSTHCLPIAMGLEAVSDLTLLLKYLSGKLPVSDFELDFGQKGTALNMLNSLFQCIGEGINCMARPVDAIKHQAKTVTVGTSRIKEKLEGILFDALESHGISLSRIINKNIIVLRNLQSVVSEINGSILYRIDKLNFLGEPTDETTIEIITKNGILKPIPSRVESDRQLKGTKRIIVRSGNVYVGKGRKDDRSILVIPAISDFPSASNMIEHLLLLNISFKRKVPLEDKIRALGGKYEHIKNIVQENNIIWHDSHLECVDIEELFGRSAEKIGEFIVSQLLQAKES